MKKIIMLMLVFVTQKFQAQITINSTHMPSNGDTIRYSNALVIGGNFNFTQTGTDFNWDFTNLTLVSQDIYKFQPLTSTPYAALAFTGMPIGAIGFKVADSIGTGQAAFKNIYNFYEKTQTTWRAVGTGFTLSVLPFPAGGVYSDKDEIYNFPLQYLDDDSTTFAVTTNFGTPPLSLGKFIQKGTRETTVDGWGIISTPYANNVSCLRVKSIIYEFDSISVPTANINFGFNTVRVEYKWLSTSEKIPMLEVTGTQIGNTFTPTQVRYRDFYRKNPLNVNDLVEDFRGVFYPNPTTEKITFKSEALAQTRVIIANTEGKIVQDSYIQDDLTLDVSDLKPKQIYYFFIYDNKTLVAQSTLFKN